jgi:hypothetical protein
LLLETEIVPSAVASEASEREVAQEFRALLRGAHQLVPAGRARSDPAALSRRYAPRFAFDLFDARFHLANLLENESFRFFVAYVSFREPSPEARKRKIHPRIFYKDSSLVWRSATHFISSEDENWIGKGAIKLLEVDGVVQEVSAEETTNLPFEMQGLLDVLSRAGGKVKRDEQALGLVLRNAPDDRLAPYADFSAPRRRAAADRRNLINGGRDIAWFSKEGDPRSLCFARGFEPDFGRRSVIEETRLRSNIYGGEMRKLRILSANRRIQYQFVAAPHQVWILPPQALTRELSSYGVRTVDVNAHEDLCVPGYEYHFMDDSCDPPELFSQIPEGYAGEPSSVDPSRADASPWIEKLPVIRDFRRKVLARR